ncbi:hypothetical protein ACWKWU_22495 [Chitinophaga lutea]
MKTSRTTFILVFVISAFVFQFITNSVLGPEARLYPPDGNWFPGMESSVGWKRTLAAIIYPVKYVLIGPLTVLAQDPDPPPPLIALALAAYWTVMAFALHLLLSLIPKRKKA